MSQALLSTVGDELLDHPDADPDAVAVSLGNVAVANRWFGGWWAVRRGLEAVLAGTRARGHDAVEAQHKSGAHLPRPLHPKRSEGSTHPASLPVRVDPSGAARPQDDERQGEDVLHSGNLVRSFPRTARLTVLDIGCGAGDLAAKTVAWGARRGLEIVPLGLERHRTAAALARRQRIATLLGCAGQLPIRDKSVDIVLASQLIHHLTPEAIVAFCQAADRLARLGVVIADLRRSPWAMAGFWLGSRALRFDAATRADGLTSVRRGFHTGELRQLLARAGVPAQVERSAGFRLVATWQPEQRP